MNDETKITVSFKNNVGGEAKLEKYRKTLLDINSVLGSMNTGAAREIETSAANTKSIATDVSKLAKQGTIAFNYTTVRAFGRAIKNVATHMGQYVSQSAAYAENLNLLRVAYDGDTKSADKFVNKLSEMYGLDESWGYRTVGIFKQLANAMGIAAEKGSQVSETLTQFAIDVSSLYNIGTNDAVQILSSALAGQTKPARRLGADITMSTLQTTLDQANIKEKVADLTYAEKRLVIITSLLNQVQEANDDWGQTIESAANQTRIMHEQWNRLTRTIGNILFPIIKTLLPYINAILMALVEIGTIIANIMADLFGIEVEENFFDKSRANVIDLYDAYTDGAGDATKANEKLKKSMMGLRSFDKLNNISSSSSTGGAGNIGGNSGKGIRDNIWKMAKKAMDDYKKNLEDIQMKATKIRDQIMEWLGFTKIVDEETGDVSFKFDHITSGTVLGALAVGGVIFNGVRKIYSILSKLGLIKLPKFSTLIKGFQTLSKLKFPTFITKLFSGGFSGAASTLAPIAALLLVIAGEIDVIAHNKDVQQKLKELKDSFKRLYDTLKPLVTEALEKLQPIFEKIGQAISVLWESLKVTLSEEWANFTNFLAFLNSISLDAINTGIQIFCDLIEGDFNAAVGHWLDHLDKMKKDIENFIKGLFDAHKIQEKVDKAKEKLNDLVTWFSELPEKAGYWAGEMLKKFAVEVARIITDKKTRDKYIEQGKKILGYIGEGLLLAPLVLNPLGIGIMLVTYIWNNILTKENKERLKNLGLEILTTIGSALTGLKTINWVIDIVKKIYNDFKTDFDKKDWAKLGKKIGSSILGGITSGLTGKVTGAISFGADFIKGLKKSLNLEAGGGIFKNGKWQPITSYAVGGLPPVGQMFVARERGPELVGTINGSTAVMNNNQIVSSVASGVYQAVRSAMATNNGGNQVYNIYLDKNNKIATYTLQQLQEMATTNGKPIRIGG